VIGRSDPTDKHVWALGYNGRAKYGVSASLVVQIDTKDYNIILGLSPFREHTLFAI